MTVEIKSNDSYLGARYGMFIHYGLYSLLARGEWVMNREQIAPNEYARLAERFDAARFDAKEICDLAVRSGMRYIVFTTMHHDGFRLYDSALSSFNSVQACGRDLTREMVEAARERGLRIALYHSLNDWTHQPDAVAALESADAYEQFLSVTFERVRELATLYNPIDVLWYDGWWPFDASGWRAEKMNAMVRAIQPHILFNGRNGLPGDFGTPEGHLSAPKPWHPWEASLTLNNSWGYHAGDHDWKTAAQIIDALATCAQGLGNLVMNIGPRGDGSIPEASASVLERVGAWLMRNGECIYDTDRFTFDLRERGDHRADWTSHGPFTAKGNNLYLLARRWPGAQLTIAGLECRVRRVALLGQDRDLRFEQVDGRVVVSDLPVAPPDSECPVFRFECESEPSMYLTGGMRTPRAAHCHYDPCESDLPH